MCRLSWNLVASTFRNLQGLSRSVMGLLRLYIMVRILVCAANSISPVRSSVVFTPVEVCFGNLRNKRVEEVAYKSRQIETDLKLHCKLQHMFLPDSLQYNTHLPDTSNSAITMLLFNCSCSPLYPMRGIKQQYCNCHAHRTVGPVLQFMSTSLFVSVNELHMLQMNEFWSPVTPLIILLIMTAL